MAHRSMEVKTEDMFVKNTKAMFNMKTMRFLLLAITSMLIILGLVMIAVGNIAYWYYHDYAFFYESSDMGRYITPSVLCIFIGSLLLIVCMFGIYGILLKSTLLVNLYAVILIVLLILQLVTVCLAYTLDVKTIWSNFDIPVWSIANPEIRQKIDFLQSSLGCCGSNSFDDYLHMQFPSNMTTVEVPSIDNVPMVLPASCCIDATGRYCTKVWHSGCKYALLNMMEHNAVVIGALIVCVMIINLLGTIFAVLLARCIRKMKSETALTMWQIKEQVIVAKETKGHYHNEQNNVPVHHHEATMA